MAFCLVNPRSKVGGFGVLPIEPRRKKTGLRGFRQGRTQTDLYSHRRRLDAWNFRFLVAKTKAMISCVVSVTLFSHMQNIGFLMARLNYY